MIDFEKQMKQAFQISVGLLAAIAATLLMLILIVSCEKNDSIETAKYEPVNKTYMLESV